MSDETPVSTKMFQSFPNRFSACIWGESGGIGRAFAEALTQHPNIGRIFLGSRSGGESTYERTVRFQFDLADETSMANAAKKIAGFGAPHLNIVATGLLSDATIRPEKSFRMQAPDALAHGFGERLLRGKALGIGAGRSEWPLRRLGILNFGKHPRLEPIPKAVERVLYPLNIAQV